jgi:hypothetical protein
MYSIAMEQITREFSDYNYDYAITQQLLSGVQQKTQNDISTWAPTTRLGSRSAAQVHCLMIKTLVKLKWLEHALDAC